MQWSNAYFFSHNCIDFEFFEIGTAKVQEILCHPGKKAIFSFYKGFTAEKKSLVPFWQDIFSENTP
jgi:hypothetical protein